MVTSGIDPSDNQRQGPSGLADQATRRPLDLRQTRVNSES